MVRRPMEPLESRALFSTWIVSTAADDIGVDGLISLREAISAANTNTAVGDAVAGEAGGDDFIFFAAALRGQTIVLSGTELLVTDRLVLNGQNRKITIDAGALSRVMAVDTAQSVWINNLTLANGVAAGGGGGVDVSGGGTTILDRVTVRDSFSIGGVGGGIRNQDQVLHVRNSTFSGNSVSGTAGDGGAIGALAGSTTVVFHSLITGNSAEGLGGGIYNAGDMTFDRSTLHANASYGAAGGGGGIANEATLYVSGSLIVNNSSLAGDGGGGLLNRAGITTVGATRVNDNGTYATTSGGGLSLLGGTLNVYNTRLQRNLAPGGTGGGIAAGTGGGGTLVVDLAAIADNAAATGAGVGVQFGAVTITNSNLTRNVTPGQGGGIYNAGGTVRVFDTWITRNRAGIDGGGISSDAVLDVHNSDINYNRATTVGGGISAAGTLTVEGSLLFANTALQFGGDGGGGIASYGSASITNSDFSSNRANGNGGGIFNAGDMILDDLSVRSNRASDGGGIYADLGAGATLSGFDWWDFRNNVPNNFAGFVLA